MIRWIQKWWWARQRQIDLEILWPTCIEMSGGDLDAAGAAFAMHAFNDPAWVREYEERLYRVIDSMVQEAKASGESAA